MLRFPTVRGVRAAAVFVTLTLTLLFVRTAVGADPIYLLRLLYSTTDEEAFAATALWNGLSAALYASSYTTPHSETITIIEKETTESVTDSVAIVTRVLAAYPTLLAVLSPFSSTGTQALLADTVLTTNNLVCFAPFLATSAMRKWDNRLYYTTAEPKAELLLLLSYALNTLRVKQLGFMYLSNSLIGETEYTQAVAAMAAGGRGTPVLYTAALDSTAPLNTTAFDTLANADVQAIIVFASNTKQTLDFVRKCLTDSRTSAAVLLGPSFLTSMLQEQYSLLAKAGTISYADNHIVNSLTNVVPTETTYAHVQLFQTEMANYIANSGTSDYADSSYFTTNLTVGSLMLSGWIAGKTLMSALSRSSWTASAAAFQTGLFEQNRYTIGSDFFVGDYGGPCTTLAAALGATCECNQGGHTAFLSTMTSYALTPANINFTFPRRQCYASSADLTSPLQFVVLKFSDSSVLASVADTISTMSAATSALATSASFDFSTVTLATTTTATTAQSTLDTYLSTHAASVIWGPFLSSMSTSLLVMEPFYKKATTRILTRNVLTLRPTIEQYFYILMGHYSTFGVSTMTIVMRGYTADEVSLVSGYATKTADNYNVNYATVRAITDAGDLTSVISTSGLTMLMGIVSGDAVTLASFLTAHTGATIFIDAQDFYMFYDEIIAAFTGMAASVQDRLMFLTNMPLWTDTSATAHAASDALAAYHAIATAPYTPLAFEMFLMTWFLESIVSNLDTISATTIIDFVYRVGIIAAKDVVYGDFGWDCEDPSSSSCVRNNFGARDIAGMSVRRVLDPTVSVVIAAITPSMWYSARPESSLSKGQLAGIIVGSVVGGLILIALIIFLAFWLCGGSRNNDVAPKNMEDPVTIMFTDIESSTALWAALPEMMPEAVATHHRVIRSVLRKHKCYEVKTIGDSFMIACRDAFSAVKVATEIQTRLLKFDWKTPEIDECYRRFEQRRFKDSSERAPTAELTREVYEALWNGLRVRMGIHTGLSDIRRDEVTKGYDYYGDTSNMAARTEAIANGGQVIMTEATWWALSSDERSSLNFRKMGPQGLRGVPHAVDMYQLNPILGRQFAGLRTEIEAAVGDDDGSCATSTGADELLSTPSILSGPATAVAFVLSSCFSTYPPAQRVRELQPLLSKWSVASQPRPSSMTEEDYCQGLVNRLAVKVAQVTRARFALSGDQRDADPFRLRPGSSSGHQQHFASSGPTFNETATLSRTAALPTHLVPSSPLAASAVSRLMAESAAEHPRAVRHDHMARAKPTPNADELHAFERSTLESTTVNPFERSHGESTALVSVDAIMQPLMQAAVVPNQSQSSIATPPVQSQLDIKPPPAEFTQNQLSGAKKKARAAAAAT